MARRLLLLLALVMPLLLLPAPLLGLLSSITLAHAQLPTLRILLSTTCLL
jgi:hypothetical protein